VKAIIIVKDRVEKKIASLIEEFFESVQVILSSQDYVSLIYMDPPDIILIDRPSLFSNEERIVQEFRTNTIFGHLPIVAVLTADDLPEKTWKEIPIDDFINADDDAQAIMSRLEFIAKRSLRDIDTNPLSRLPGNESVIRHIQRMFDEGRDVAVAWVDIDNFKPFNDRYGFSRGDEVILATARIITNAVREINDSLSFVGHIGGDDFVFICPGRDARTLCEEIIERFDLVIRNFYNEEDLANDGITTTTREGTEKAFPVMTISIAVVINRGSSYSHYGEASRDATDIKKYIKSLEGSNFMIDRRGAGA